MKENQDDSFVWRHDASNSVVIGVFDGHGRDVGKLAAVHAKAHIVEWLDKNFDRLLSNPSETFKSLFEETHSSILQAFKKHLTSKGWTVKETGGYLIKRRSMSNPWTCAHGGTTCSIIVILGKNRIITANVGDSTGLISCKNRNINKNELLQLSLWPESGGIIEECNENDKNKKSNCENKEIGKNALIITADHSPESIREFYRLRNSHPYPREPILPHLSIVYDSPNANKMKCQLVFQFNENGEPFVTGNGAYFKNVRKEWASLVATPMRARFQDALAFTRSLGDFHLQCYGVSHVPDVHFLDLENVFYKNEESSVIEGKNEMVSCIVLCSDGVWDNWQWDEVVLFFMDSFRINEVYKSGNCSNIVKEFMSENMRRSQNNFGYQADNATAVVCYVFMSEDPLAKV